MPAREAEEALSPLQLALERLLLGLRTYDGIAFSDFDRTLGIDLAASNAALLDRLVRDRLATRDGDRLKPTLDGLAVADGLAACFEIPTAPPPA